MTLKRRVKARSRRIRTNDWPTARRASGHNRIRRGVVERAVEVHAAVSDPTIRIGVPRQSTDDHAGRCRGIGSQQLRGRPGNDRGRSRRSRDAHSVRDRVIGLDADTGRRDEHRGARVRTAPQRVRLVRRADADDFRVARRVVRRRTAVVAGSRHDDNAVSPRVVHRVLQRVRVAGVRERHHCDVGAVVGRPYESGDDVGVLTGARRIEHLHRHDVDAVEADAGDAAAVVRRRAGDRRDPRSVSVRVGARVAAEGGPTGARRNVARLHTRVEDGDRRDAGDRGRAVRLVPPDLGK